MPPITFKPVGKASLEGDQIKIPGRIEFDVDKAQIREDKGTEEVLVTLIDVLKKNPNITKIRIEGHTDNAGSPDYNLKLSKDRADAVRKYLELKGIDKDRVDTSGLGETAPVVANDSNDHRQLNRRTEFHIITVDGKTVDGARFRRPLAVTRPPASLPQDVTDGGAPAVPQVPVPAATAVVKPGDAVMKSRL
jgi:hypothetical protein